jgi:ribosomal protein S12 methylthiotransferase
LIDQARAYADAGVKELVLVAQDSTAYGEEAGDRDGLPALLRELAAAVPQVPWLRLMYAYPGRVSQPLVETMAAVPQVCHYLDIPLQHGSPTVLRRMKRPHNVPMVLDTLARLRAAMPDIAIRTTFIVGFPGETDDEFQELLDFVATARFDRAGAFLYSPQDGTPAAVMPDQVAEPVKVERLERLMTLQTEIAAEINDALIGREIPILVESVEGSTGPDGEPIFVGRSYRDAPEIDGLVFVQGLARAGTMPRVRITAAMEHDLLATRVGTETALPLLQT